MGSTPLKKQSTEGNDRQPAMAIAAPKSRNATSVSEAKRGLIDNQRQFRLLVESVDDYAIYMLDPDGVVASWNPGVQRIKGYTRADVVGQPFDLFFTEEDRIAGLPQRTLQRALAEGRCEVEGWRRRKDGSRFWANAVIDTIRDGRGALLGFAKVTRDMSDRRRYEEHLYRLAHFDPLTELPNREALRTALREALNAEPPVTVLMLDLDGFKEINDTLGHAAGDAILKAAAQRLRTCIGTKGMVGRLGGDEFAVVLPRLADPMIAASTCEELIDAFSAPIAWEDQDSYLGLSIGACMGPRHGDTAEELLASADLALYRAKAEGRHGYSLFQLSFRQAVIARRTCELELRRAVAEGELELHYQPQIQLVDRLIMGAEALLRWRHPQHGLLAPGAFLHVLESGTLAVTVGDWVIRMACAYAANMRGLGFAGFSVGVNLFGAQFRNDSLVSIVTDALHTHALPPDALELEITENIILRHDEAMIAPLRELRALGVAIAFDDYGTGYASLSLLKRFPLTRLKIDRSFVRNLGSDPGDAALIRSILYLAENFGLEATAEGIETELQESLLRDLGCRFGQGFLYGRPMPAPQMLELLTRQIAGSVPRRTARAV